MTNEIKDDLSKANQIKSIHENYNKKLKILIQKQYSIITRIVQKFEANKIEDIKKKLGL